MDVKKLSIVAGTIIGLVAISFFYIKIKKNRRAVNPIRTEHPVTQDITQYVNASGKLKALVQITVGSLVAGRVVKIMAEDNDIVKKDQVLAVLDDGIGDSEVKRTTADLKEAQANFEFQEKFYNRQKELFSFGQISQNSFDEITQAYKVSKSRLEKLQATLELHKKQYENLFVRAPEDSIVISKMIDLGQMVTAQLQATALYTLAQNLQEMEAHVDVDEADIGLVKKGQEVIFTVDAFPKKKFTAKVKYIKYLATTIDNVVTYDVVLNVANPDLKLRPGMTVNVDIKVAGSSNALTVPNKALRVDSEHVKNAAKLLGLSIDGTRPKTPRSASKVEAAAERETLWVLKDNKTLTTVEVKLGANDGRFTEIKSKITSDDKIVTEVDDVNRENVLLKSVLGKPAGGLGK